MDQRERDAVHRLAGAFSRLSLAAELVQQAQPGPGCASLVVRMETTRHQALRDFAAAMDVLSAPAPVESATELRDCLEIMLAAAPKPSSAALDPLPVGAAEAPATSTPLRLAPDAGGGRAVPAAYAPRPGTIAAEALELAAKGPFTALQLASATKRGGDVCATTCHQLKKRGLLVYHPVPLAARRNGLSGTYSLPGAEPPAASKPRPSMEPRLARIPGEALADEAAELARYGVRRVPVEQAARVSARAVPGVQTKADFFATKDPLPAARPVVVPERGARHG